MSKRGAEEYITKEHGSTPNAVSDGNKVKMATAAQLAKRKMAVPKSRAGRTGQSPVPSAGSSNPFAGTSTFGAPQNNQQQTFSNPGGITFGASQSFPPGDSSSNNGFTFSAPGQSSSFTFGQTASNNPFANLNGSSSNDQPQGLDSNDTIMESPQKKPVFGSNLFGSNGSNIENKFESAGFAFVQSTNQPPGQPAFSFGQSQGFGSTPSSSPFGQTVSKSVESSSGSNPFGQTSQGQTSAPAASTLFGQQTSTSQEQKPLSGFSFGQPTTAAPSSAPTVGFGQPASSNPTTSSPAPAFSFGQPPKQTTSSDALFGGNKQSEQASFGLAAPASTSISSTSLFGSAPAGSTNDTFAGFGSLKPTGINPSANSNAAPEPPKPTLFGKLDSNSSQAEPDAAPAASQTTKTNPFAGLFAQNPAQSSVASPAESTKLLFNFASPVQPSGMFAAPKSSGAESTSKPVEDSPKKPLFSFGTPSATPSPALFSPSKSANESSAVANPLSGLSSKNDEPTIEKPRQSLFGQGRDPSSKDSDSLASKPAFSGFSFDKPATAQSSQVPSLFGGFNAEQHSETAKSAKRTFDEQSSSNQTSSPPVAGTFTIEKATEPSKPMLQSSAEISKSMNTTGSILNATSPSFTPTKTDSAPMRSVNTNPPVRIPPYLNGDDYKAYDSNYRLHSLNREFQKRVASLDPSRDDFENIVRNYVAARESIGESIGLYSRNVAGMKRKSDDGDDRRGDDPPTTKKAKPGDEAHSKSSFQPVSASTSVFKPVPSSMPQRSAAPASVSTAKPTSSASNVSSLFNSMIPDGKTNSASSINPFAGLPKSNTANTGASSQKPVFSFGNSTKPDEPVGSTTPTKSPPKKPAFEIPKFTAPVGGMNFMDAFKKQSDASAAKFAKEAKDKRKAEEFDSDEDDEAEWTRKYEEEERAKREKVQSVVQTGFKPNFGNSLSSAKPAFSFGGSSSQSSTPKPATGFTFGGVSSTHTSDKPIDISDNSASAEENDEEGDEETEDAEGEDADGEAEEETEEDDLPEDEINGDEENEEDEDFETALARSRSQGGKSLFDRITPNPNLQKDSASNGTITPSIERDTVKKPSAVPNIFGKGTPEAPSFSPLTPTGAKEPYVPSKTFTFTPTPPSTSASPMPGASIFAGGLMKDGPIAGEGLFGSRPSTPSNADKPKSNVFAGLGTPSTAGPADHTWKKGSEIKFGTSNGETPTLSITEPSPRKEEAKPFANLFGANSSSANSSLSNGVGFSFGQSPVPGFLSAASHLTGGSGTTSGLSSRATSPGTTDNESVATNEEDYSNDDQVSLMETRPGEENERVIFESRARALRFYTEEQTKGTKLVKGWNSVGLGPARLLKHKETGKTRLVMRAEPGANIILNTNLMPAVKYEYVASGNAGTVKFNVVASDGIQGWILKMKTTQQGQELAKMMEENKTAKT